MNLPWVLVTSYAMFFFTDIALIPTAYVSLIFLFGRIFDAVNDPLIGILSDRTNTRFGRYRPWMLAGGLLLVPAVILLFWAHPDWSVGARTAYSATLYFICVLAATMWDIPYGGLNACITPYSKERATFATSRILVSSLASAVGSGLFLTLVNYFGEKQGDPNQGWVMAAALLSIIAIPFAFITFFGTKEVIKPPKEQKLSAKSLITTITKNKPLLILLFGFFIYGFMNFGRGSATMYYFTYYWNDPSLISIYFFVLGILSGVAAFAGTFLLKSFKTKRNLCLFGFAILAASSIIASILNPLNSTTTIMTIVLWIGGAANGLVTGMIYAMVPDTVEYGQWKSGVRADGFIYGATSFLMQLGAAIGPAFLGFTIDKAGYVPAVSTQNSATLNMINLNMNILPAILSILAILLFRFYKLDDKLHAKILFELSNRESAVE